MDFPRLAYAAIALPQEAIEGLGVRASEAYEGNGTLVLLVENSKILIEAQPNLTFMKDRKIFASSAKSVGVFRLRQSTKVMI